jgi:hypothetical protein
MADEVEKFVNEKVLLVEYEKAQDSAEHHDQLLWVVVGLLVTGLAALLMIPPGHRPPPNDSVWERFYPPVAGITISFLLFYFIHSFRYFRDEKYKRCKAIEGILGMKHHLMLKDQKLKQIWVVYGLSGIFLLVWVFRLCWELHRGCGE